jgi:hypothetical protein
MEQARFGRGGVCVLEKILEIGEDSVGPELGRPIPPRARF